MVDRPRRLNIRIAEREGEMLADIGEHEGLSQSDLIRQWIRAEHAALFGAPEPKKPHKRK